MWNLPESLQVGDSFFAIRTDYRDILTIFQAYNDPELPDWAKTEIMLRILYKDYDKLPPEQLYEAVAKAAEFINHGFGDNDAKKPKLMDWEQDADIIVPAINKVAGVGDVRALDYLHWWTFLGYYMEINEGLFTQVLNIRYKRAHGKKLEKWEREFEKDNLRLIKLKTPMTEAEKAREQAEREALKELIGE